MMRCLMRQLLLLGAIALCTAGCSKASVGLVKGKVFYNNEPLSAAELEFKPEKDLALGAFGGQTDAEGRFEIKIGKGTGMNARPGRYAVLITKGKSVNLPPVDSQMSEEERVKILMQMGPGGPGAASGPNVGTLPGKYASASTTPFKVDISEGENDLNPFRLDGPPLKKRS